MRFGVSLPHYSDECTFERLVGFAPTLERLGFGSFWVRDHLNFRPGEYDPPGRRFVDPFIALAALSSVTTSAKLGFAVAIPTRHPLITTQLMGSLSWISNGRVEMGIGIGGGLHQFEAVGISHADRIQLTNETAEVLRAASEGQAFSYHGQLTNFDEVEINPAPAPGTPIWYGGYSRPALRRAVKYCDGILPARTPFSKMDIAQNRLEELAEEAGRPLLRVGSAPFVSIGASYEDAFEKVSDRIDSIYREEDVEHQGSPGEDLAGALVVGTADQCAEQLQGFHDRKYDVVVLDCRLRMAEFEDVMTQFGEEVLPKISK
jgi:alkanesulfonate monooxygenase SsuD/methylene tetrahydromethanopterin reductase-like flavin-dependent oxidoreductase (luciferase family)